MRATRAAGERLQHLADLRHQRPRRRFEIVAPGLPARPAARGRRRPSRRKPGRSEAGRPGSRAAPASRRGRVSRPARSRRPCPRRARSRLSRQAGTSAPSVAAISIEPARKHSRSSTAAASAEPPPSPAADRKPLVEGQRRPPPRTARARAQHEIVALSRQRSGEGPGHAEAQHLRRLGDQHVAVLAEGEQRLDPVIAVRLPRPHVQGEVELRIGDLAHQRAASSGVRPRSILAVSRWRRRPRHKRQPRARRSGPPRGGRRHNRRRRDAR